MATSAVPMKPGAMMLPSMYPTEMPGQMPDGVSGVAGDQGLQVESTPSNPQTITGEQQSAEQQLSDEDKNVLVNEVIKPYLIEWSADRVNRLPKWLKNTEFDKGNQILSWDPVSKTWFDAVAWYRQSGNGDEDCTYLEKYVNNITQMLRKSYVAAVARGIPPILISPEDAENLKDSTTATAAQEAISIIERMNSALAQIRLKAHNLYLYGCSFTRTRFVIDGGWAGMKKLQVAGEAQVTFPGHLHCRACGTDTMENEATPTCPCGADYGRQDYYPPESMSVPTMSTAEQEGGMVKWSIYSPLQVMVDPTCDKLAQTPLLSLDREVDIADLRATFPAELSRIKEGMESSTDPNSSYARLVRAKVFGATVSGSDNTLTQKPTFSEIWVQPTTYYRKDDQGFIARMQALYPKGCKVSMTGDVVLEVKAAELTKEWTMCRLDEKYGPYSPAIADNVVPFNERFNNSSNIIDDWMERCSAGMVGFDPNRIDGSQIDGKAMLPGVWTPMPTVGEGIGQPLENAMVQFEYRFEPSIFNYQDRLMNFCQLLSGVPPQVFGGGAQEGVETAKGQKQALDQALGKLGLDWNVIKEEYYASAQNAVECLQRNRSLCPELFNVIKERGSEFRNNYVDLDTMTGKVRVYGQVDEGLPMTAEQKRDWWQNMINSCDKNPVAQAFMDDPTNQETAARAVGVTDAVVPKSAARSKTLQDIYKLLQGRALPQMGPDGKPQMGPDGEPVFMPSFAPEKWMEDYTELKATMMQFGQENCDLRQANSRGWQNFIAYYRLACQYEVEVESYFAGTKAKVQQAGVPTPPAPPQPDPKVLQAKAELTAVAKGAVDRLQTLSQLPPLGKNASIQGQVGAAKELVDTAIKVAQAA